jgi:hypothetical protein
MTPEAHPGSLFLVDPEGGRYDMGRYPGGLADWSGDGQRALFVQSDQSPATSSVVDLVTGQSTYIPFAGNAHFVVKFTRPKGMALIGGSPDGGATSGTITRFDLTGKAQMTYPTSFPGAGRYAGFAPLETPDGTQLILTMDKGIEVITNAGQPVRFIPFPPQGAHGWCSGDRWWKVDVVLATCRDGWFLIPISGDPSTPLAPWSALPDATAAYYLPSGSYFSGCRPELQRLNADGSTSRVAIPGLTGDPMIVGSSSNQFILLTGASCAGAPAIKVPLALESFDPGSGTVVHLLDAWVDAALAFPQ